MANDKDWQRRSDEWVKSMHDSRLRKEKRSKNLRKNNEKQNKLMDQSDIKSKDFS